MLWHWQKKLTSALTTTTTTATTTTTTTAALALKGFHDIIIVYVHLVYNTSSTDISSTGISSTTVYQGTGQLYIQLLFQQIIIFINSNFYLHYDSLYQSHFH